MQIKPVKVLEFKLLTVVLLALLSFDLAAQPAFYKIDASTASIQLHELNMGGQGKNGQEISVNNLYMAINKLPVIPVTGEFHFSRYPAQYWDEAIKKMKAGGITMLATYVFWNIHEEKEGKFDWSGNRDLRRFMELCKQNNIQVIIRIGPFCHGEIRNGGIPDWVLGKPFGIRSNNPGYLALVDRLYTEIGKQLSGLYFKDGGPIVATQIENEYQHAAAPWGLTYPGQPYDMTAAERDLGVTHEGVAVSTTTNPFADLGRDHMKVLKSLAIKAGIQTPLYTATGWGNAAIVPDESLPVTAAYAYPTWTAHKDLSPFYLFKDMRRDPDYSPVSFDPAAYPVFAAEMGSGIMTTYSRRPLVPAESVDALVNRSLGSGANGIGYYMFHGGSTPKGEFFFNDEAYAYPKISYDFQAPLGEYGQVRPSFQRLKLIHFFIAEFGRLLAPMVTVLPGNLKDIKAQDTVTLRYAVRISNESGFLFVNNFQDHAMPTGKKNIRVEIKTKRSAVSIPVSVDPMENAIFPFNFDINGSTLLYATAQLLTKGDNPVNPYYVFFTPEGSHPEFKFKKSGGLKVKGDTHAIVSTDESGIRVNCADKGISAFTVTQKGVQTKILVVDKKMALQAYQVQLSGKRHLVFSEAMVIQKGADLEVLSTGSNNYRLSFFPELPAAPKLDRGKLTKASDELMSNYTVDLPVQNPRLIFTKIDEKRLAVQLPLRLPDGINDFFLDIDYTGDTGMGFINGELVTDEFYKGIPWRIGLKRFMSVSRSKEMLFYFRPLYKNATYLIDLDPGRIPDFGAKKSVLHISGVKLTPEYKSLINFNAQN